MTVDIDDLEARFKGSGGALAPDELILLASHTDNPSILGALAVNRDHVVRECVASNADTTAELLVALSTDVEGGVRDLVARHQRTPIDTLRSMHGDGKTWEVHIAENPNCPADLLAAISKEAVG